MRSDHWCSLEMHPGCILIWGMNRCAQTCPLEIGSPRTDVKTRTNEISVRAKMIKQPSSNHRVIMVKSRWQASKLTINISELCFTLQYALNWYVMEDNELSARPSACTVNVRYNWTYYYSCSMYLQPITQCSALNIGLNVRECHIFANMWKAV